MFVSAASIWEASIKAAIGKLELRASLAETVVRAGLSPLPIDFSHAEAVRALPRLHADPFDRMLVAQAQIEELHLVSRDSILATYPVSFLLA